MPKVIVTETQTIECDYSAEAIKELIFSDLHAKGHKEIKLHNISFTVSTPGEAPLAKTKWEHRKDNRPVVGDAPYINPHNRRDGH